MSLQHQMSVEHSCPPADICKFTNAPATTLQITSTNYALYGTHQTPASHNRLVLGVCASIVARLRAYIVTRLRPSIVTRLSASVVARLRASIVSRLNTSWASGCMASVVGASCASHSRCTSRGAPNLVLHHFQALLGVGQPSCQALLSRLSPGLLGLHV